MVLTPCRVSGHSTLGKLRRSVRHKSESFANWHDTHTHTSARIYHVREYTTLIPDQVRSVAMTYDQKIPPRSLELVDKQHLGNLGILTQPSSLHQRVGLSERTSNFHDAL